MNNTANMKLSMKERMAYGAGDYAQNLVYSAISAFLLVYYTNVLGFNAGLAAQIILISKLFDGVSDLIMGYVIDHTHSRFGKARPWLLRLCIPLAVSTILMFSVPASLQGRQQILYIFITYNLTSTVFFTGINVPYAALNGLMTTNQYERGLLGNFRNLFATAGTMTVNTFLLKLAGLFGNGDLYTQKGWTFAIIIFMIAFIGINMITFAVCKERVCLKEQAENDSDKKEDGSKNNIENLNKKSDRQNKVSFLSCVKALITNKYWVLIIICCFFIYFLMSCFFGSTLYFSQYNIGNTDTYVIISNCLSVAQIIFLFVTPFIMKKVSKRNLFMYGIIFAGIGFILSGITTNVTLNCISSVLKGIGLASCGATMYGMIQDTITYGEWYHGYSMAGIGNAASSFCTKLGSGLGTAALGKILSKGGFEEVQNGKEATASVLFAIHFSFAWLPAICIGIMFVCLIFFDLDKKYDKIASDLEQGKHRI